MIRFAQRLPDRSTPPVEVDLSALCEGLPPFGRVTLIGEIKADQTITLEESLGRPGSSTLINQRTLYVPVHAKQSRGGPLRFFIDRSSQTVGRPGGSQPVQVFLGDHFTGVMIENGLPANVLVELEKRKLVLAKPHFLVTTRPEGGRTPYYVGAAVGGFIAGLCLLVAVLQTGMIRRTASETG